MEIASVLPYFRQGLYRISYEAFCLIEVKGKAISESFTKFTFS